MENATAIHPMRKTMLGTERNDHLRTRVDVIGATFEEVDERASMADRVNQCVRMKQLLCVLHRLVRHLRCLIDVAKMPECPASVAQGGDADVLAVVISELRMALAVIKRPGLLEMSQSGGEFTADQAGGAERAMRDAERRRVAVSLGLRHQFDGCRLLLD